MLGVVLIGSRATESITTLFSDYTEKRARRIALKSRLDAAESIPHLLTTIYAMEGRVRPYHKYLVWELEHRPLLEPEWQAPNLLPRLEAMLATGDPALQRRMFADVERVASREP